MNKCIDSDIQEMLPDLLHRALADDELARVRRQRAWCHGWLRRAWRLSLWEADLSFFSRTVLEHQTRQGTVSFRAQLRRRRRQPTQMRPSR